MRELTVDLFITADGHAKDDESPAFFGHLVDTKVPDGRLVLLEYRPAE